MSPTVVPTDVASYLAAVREALGDLRADERDDLLVEVEASVLEAAGEDDRPIAELLGPPEEFAAELRTSAGLAPAAPAVAGEPNGLLAGLRAALATVGTDQRVRSIRRVLGELAPIWWVARAYVAVVLVARLAGAGWASRHPGVPRISGSGFTLIILGAAVAGSIAFGLRERARVRPAPRALILANLVLAVAAIPAAAHLATATSASVGPVEAVPSGFAVPSPKELPGLVSDGVPVLNIYPYTRDGRLLHDVLLYDQNGRPLDVMPGDTDPTRRVLSATGGQRIFDSFPIRHFEPGTTRVANPNAAPPLLGPSLFSPAAPSRPAARKPAAATRRRR